MKNNLARSAINRVTLNDCLVGRSTIEQFLLNLQEFQQTPMEGGAERQTAFLDSVASAYGYGPSSGGSKPFIFNDGMAVIPVHGVLLNRFGSSWGFVTGYNFVRAQMNAALVDDDVTTIILDVDSPGGEAVGCFELCEEIRDAREVKPIIAVVDSLAASGGYAIASGAGKIVVTPSGSAGSISAYRVRVDLSKMFEAEGIGYHVIEADERKADGHPAKPMSDEEKTEALASVQKRRDEFFDLVTANRPISRSVLADMAGRLYRADEALAFGLIDAVSSPATAISDFLAELANENPEEDEEEALSTMTDQEHQAALDQARSDAVKAERQRISAITGCDEAKDKSSFAAHFAHNTSMSLDDAKAALVAAAPEVVAEAPKPKVEVEGDKQQTGSHFERAMSNGKQPEVGSEGNAEDKGGTEGAKVQTDEEKAQAILGDQSKFTGAKLRLAGGKDAA